MPDALSFTAGALLEILIARIALLSRRRHEDSTEQARLEDQARLLRLGVSTPEAVILALANQGVRLRGVVVVPTEAKGRSQMARKARVTE